MFSNSKIKVHTKQTNFCPEKNQHPHHGKQNDAWIWIQLQSRKFFVAQPIKWMNLKDTNLLDRVNEIYAFPAPYAIKYRLKRKWGYIQFSGHQPKHSKLVWACNVLKYPFIINVLKTKITKNLSLVKNLPIFTNRNKRNLVLSCPWSTTINLS